MVDVLINNEAQASINVGDISDCTPLQCSIAKQRYEMAIALIRAGADVNKADKKGTTSLVVAAGHNVSELVRILLCAGALYEGRNINNLVHSMIEMALKRHTLFMEPLVASLGGQNWDGRRFFMTHRLPMLSLPYECELECYIRYLVAEYANPYDEKGDVGTWLATKKEIEKRQASSLLTYVPSSVQGAVDADNRSDVDNRMEIDEVGTEVSTPASAFNEWEQGEKMSDTSQGASDGDEEMKDEAAAQSFVACSPSHAAQENDEAGRQASIDMSLVSEPEHKQQRYLGELVVFYMGMGMSEEEALLQAFTGGVQ